MLSMHKWLLGTLAAAGLVLGVATLPTRAADEATGKGSISGTVVDKDGKGVADVTVHLMKGGMGRGNRGGAGAAAGNGEKKQSTLNHDAVALQAQGKGGNRPQPIATATTDKDGKFTMKDVPAGEYMVGVRDTDKKVFGHASVKVEDGKEATVEIKTSDTPPQGRPGRNRGGAGNGQ